MLFRGRVAIQDDPRFRTAKRGTLTNDMRRPGKAKGMPWAALRGAASRDGSCRDVDYGSLI